MKGLKCSVFVVFFICLYLWSIPYSISAEAQRAFDPERNFTIKSISKWPGKKGIKVVFTEPCSKDTLKRLLRFYPPVYIYWYDSNLKDNTLYLDGKFRPGQEYSIFIPPQMRCNGKTYVPTRARFRMPDLNPEISMADNATVIERDSRQLLNLKVQNIEELTFRSLRLSALHLGLLKDRDLKLPWDELRGLLDSRAQALEDLIKVYPELQVFYRPISRRQQLFFPQGKTNRVELFSMPLTFRPDRQKGSIEIVSFAGRFRDKSVTSANYLLAITDTSISYKLSKKTLLIWLTSLRTGRPLSGVRVIAITKDNYVVLLGSSDKDGLIRVDLNHRTRQIPLVTTRKRVSLFRKSLSILMNIFRDQKAQPAKKALMKPIRPSSFRYIVAQTEDDVSFIRVKGSGNIRADWVTQERNVSTLRRPLKGHIFTDRGIYRPGEKVHFKVTIREFKDRAVVVPQTLKIRLQIEDSKGNTVYKKTNQGLTEFGTFSGTFNIPSYAHLGRYTITVYFGKDRTSRTFQVQQFRRPRHYVQIGFRHIRQKARGYVNIDRQLDILQCNISGRYYAGGPVKHGRVRWKVYLAPTRYQRKDYPGYIFGNFLTARTEMLESGEAMLDERGTISINIPMNREVLQGVYGIEVVATVVDIDGRAYTDSAVFQEKPAYPVGISRPSKTKLSTDETQRLKIIVLDRKGRTLKRGNVKVQVMKMTWTYVRKRNKQGDLYWQWKQLWKKDSEVLLPIKDSMAVFEFDFRFSGDYLLKFIYQDREGHYSVSSIKYTVNGGQYYSRTRERARNFEKLNLLPEKTTYRPGETIRIYLRPPRGVSSVLMTIERDDILESRIVHLRPSQKYIELKAREQYIPNIYVGLLATTPRTDFPVYTTQYDRGSPSLFYGVVNIEVKSQATRLKVEIAGPEQLRARPAEELVLSLKVTDPEGRAVASEVAIGVVDESVLAMTGYKTPELTFLTRFNLPLSVFTGDLRPLLLKQSPFKLITPPEVTGGGGLAKLPGEVTGKLRKDFRPVAYFNPSVRTDERGRAEVRFKLPDTMTKYRVYAVACDNGSRFGSTQKALLVTKDFYIEPGMPRFFTKGDIFRFKVTAFNRTSRHAIATLAVDADRALTLKPITDAIRVGPNDSGVFTIQGQATGHAMARIRFGAGMDSLKDSVEIKLPVSSGYLLWDDVLFGEIKGKKRLSYNFPPETRRLKGSEPGPGDLKVLLTVSGSPFVRLQKALRYLLKYPYGCVEQTSSGVLPLAAMRDLIKKDLIPGITLKETDKFLSKGIARLLSMQTPSGGFSYWPGRLNPHRWGTVYATVALSYAKLAGASVPEDKLNRALSYLSAEIRQTDKNQDRTFDGFAAYALALNRKLPGHLFNELFRRFNTLSREGAMMLLLAGYEGGYLKRNELKALARLIIMKKWHMKRSDVFYARYREPAISVLLGASVMRDDPLVGQKAKMLLEGLNRKGIWTSTSDTGWALVALGRYFESFKVKKKKVHLRVAQPGSPERSYVFDASEALTIELSPGAFLKEPSVEIVADSDVVYLLSVRFPRADFGRKGYFRGFRVVKEIKNTDGSGEVHVGDIVKVILTIYVDVKAPRFIVIDDPLPAGLVAINSAIKTEELVSGERKTSWDYWDPDTDAFRLVPNYFEIRDDRVLAFRDRAWKGTYRYEYYARAVCEGEFVVPSTKVQLMYEPDVVGITPVSKLVIKPQQ